MSTGNKLETVVDIERHIIIYFFSAAFFAAAGFAFGVAAFFGFGAFGFSRRFGGLLRLRRYAALRWPPSPSPRRGGGLLLRGGGGGSRCGRGGGGDLLLFGVGALDFVVGEPAAAAALPLARRGIGRAIAAAELLPPPPALDEAAEDASTGSFRPARAYGDSTLHAAAAAAGGLFEPEMT
ncbi:hypothetical protein EVAR_62507_1 [Eumeta japonica]|uniref:Uncharacterized protein n=1 Tax=Eumeta variegata TaxID=151549 RepID=A0A4C1SG81_EUMVA|nr:hypothetical protein EVAR_62507_1 [Eumeta japonica]